MLRNRMKRSKNITRIDHRKNILPLMLDRLMAVISQVVIESFRMSLFLKKDVSSLGINGKKKFLCLTSNSMLLPSECRQIGVFKQVIVKTSNNCLLPFLIWWRHWHITATGQNTQCSISCGVNVCLCLN